MSTKDIWMKDFFQDQPDLLARLFSSGSGASGEDGSQTTLVDQPVATWETFNTFLKQCVESTPIVPGLSQCWPYYDTIASAIWEGLCSVVDAAGAETIPVTAGLIMATGVVVGAAILALPELGVITGIIAALLIGLGVAIVGSVITMYTAAYINCTTKYLKGRKV